MTGLAATLSDAEWAELSPKVIGGHFPTARPDQRRPSGDWLIWLILAGRGWGKNRTGAEDLVEQTEANPGDYFVAAPTFRDMRAVCVEGAGSGLLAILTRRAIGHEWNVGTSQIALGNGSRIYAGSADEPDRWRGYNFSGGWCDELATWRRPDTFTQLRLATRVGTRPRITVTTTPRPVPLLTDLVERDDGTVHVTRGRTWDNAENLSDVALAELRHRYAGTRIGRQELEGELLTDVPGALWSLAGIDHVPEAPPLVRVVVAVDPAVTSGEDADDTGIVVAGTDAEGHVYVLADETCHTSPDAWARRVVGLVDEWEADRVVGEVNNGGDLVESVLRAVDPNLPYRAVNASRGKRVRAEPVAALYEQGRVHHIGAMPELEDQMCGWVPDQPGASPDRVDALVWAVTDLVLGGTGRRRRGLVASGVAA